LDISTAVAPELEDVVDVDVLNLKENALFSGFSIPSYLKY